MPVPKVVKFEVKLNQKFKAGQIVAIKQSLNMNMFGSLVNDYFKRFKFMNAEVVRYIPNTTFKRVEIQPEGYKGTIRVDEKDLDESLFLSLNCPANTKTKE